MKSIERVVIGISLIILIVLSTMIIGNAWFTVFFYDDFIHAGNIGVSNVGFFEYLKASLAFTKMMYMSWQGTYFSMFIQALLSPLNNGGLIQLRIVMVINAILFLTSLVLFVNSLIRYINKDISFAFRIVIIALLYFQLFSSLSYPEIFSWFSGAVCYSYPLSFLFISISLALLAEEKKKNKYLILAVITGFCGMGGVLAITGMGCAFLLVMIIVPLLTERKLKKYLCKVFGSYFALALVGTLAPGNFLRRSNVEGSISPIKTLFLSGKKYFYSIESIIKDTKIVIILMILLVIGLFIGKIVKNSNIKKYIITSLLMFIVPYVTLFPIILGYGGYSYFPNRCTFLLNLTLTPLIMNMALLLGIIITKYLNSDLLLKETIVVISVLTFVLALVYSNRIEENLAVVQINNLMNGRVKTFYNECNYMLSEIENSEESDVILDHNPSAVPYFAEFYLSDDETFAYNIELAKYYKKNSIKVN